MIKLIFECGHEGKATGSEENRPVCPIDGSPISRVIAPKPRITFSKDLKREN